MKRDKLFTLKNKFSKMSSFTKSKAMRQALSGRARAQKVHHLVKNGTRFFNLAFWWKCF